MPSQVAVVLRTFPEQLAVIRAQYERDVMSRQMSDGLPHDIARLIEDCQRALDWTATDLDRAYGKASNRSPYFPLQDAPARFTAAMKRDFPTVPQPVFDALERHQPYQPGKSDLGYLHDLSRVNKHQDFAPQTRTESRRVRAASPGQGAVEWDPGAVTFGSGVLINGVPVDPRTQRPVPSPTITVTETIYVGWNFVAPPVPVLQTLESLTILIAEAVADVRRGAAL